jgi:hypothetical protein
METETTTNIHSTDEIVVTTEVISASTEAGSDLVAVAVDTDGTQSVLTDSEYRELRPGSMDADGGTHVMWCVAVSLGYVDDDGDWAECERLTRDYWTSVDEHGRESCYASALR